MSPEKLIQLRGVTKQYGTGDAAFLALCGVDLDIHRGEFVAIMGPSGSGKSTLMNLLGCLDTPTSGSYQFKGIAVEELNKDQRSLLRRHALGFIFQGFNLLARTSALENVELPLLYRGYSRKQRHEMAREALAQVSLSDKERNTPAELSGGQQQRVAIARALVHEPTLIICDEPTAALDAKNGHVIMELFEHVARGQDRAVLIVTHDNRIFHHANRIASMDDGKVIEVHDVDAEHPPPDHLSVHERL
jgi:putative ABC transport system ATP-binding protein